MNFNFHNKPDYQLNTVMIDEMIRLYGTPVRFVVMDKIQDSSVNGNFFNSIFNDFKTLKSDLYRDSLEFYVLLAENEEYPNGLQFAFNQFGLVNDDTSQVFVSLQSLESLADETGRVHPKEIISNVLVFPNGKVMEITDCQLHVPGVNNKFVYSNNPSCYQLSLKSYAFDKSAVDCHTQNDSRLDIAYGDPNETKSSTFENIDAFFEAQDAMANEISEFAQEEQLVPNQCNPLQDQTKSTKVDDVFGSYA